jgi:hypothetical protein
MVPFLFFFELKIFFFFLLAKFRIFFFFNFFLKFQIKKINLVNRIYYFEKKNLPNYLNMISKR